MNKILITIYVAKIDEEYDLLLPINLKMKHAIDLIQESIVEMSGNYYVINKNALLFDSVEGKVINTNNIVKFSGLKNGSKVMLV